MTRQRIPGLSLAVAHEGRLVVARGYGFANLEHEVPATDRTIYQSGSVGKQFTAAAVMLLVEDGRLSLDDRLSTFFENSPDSWKTITVRHLLTHTSGIAELHGGHDRLPQGLRLHRARRAGGASPAGLRPG